MKNGELERQLSIVAGILSISLVWIFIYQRLLVPRVDSIDGTIIQLVFIILPLAVLYIVFLGILFSALMQKIFKGIKQTDYFLHFKISIILILTLSVSSLVSMLELHHEKELGQYSAGILATDKINRFQNIIRNAEIATRSLELLVKSEGGTLANFDEIAHIILQSSPGITNLQLAKDGIITNIYPLSGNEAAIGHNLLVDPERNKEAVEAVKDNKITLAGPFNLIQGGKAVIARNPVMMDNKFWGFTSALLLLDSLLDNSTIPGLTHLGYNWTLTRLLPDTGMVNQFAGNLNINTHSSINIEFAVPNATWRLEMIPKEGWISTKTIWAHSALMMLLISLFIYFVYITLNQPLIKRQLMRKRSRQLIEEKLLLSQTQELANTGSWRLDLKSGFFTASKEFYQIYHISPGSAASPPYFYDAIHPDDAVKISNIQTKLLSGRAHEVEFRLLFGDEVSWIKETAMLQRDHSNTPVGIIGACQNITTQKRIEQTLKISEERFELALSGADLGFWDANLVTGEAKYNERWFEILGYKTHELEPTVQQFESLLHPDDVKVSRHNMMQHIIGKTSRYSADLRIRGKSGDWLWIQSVGKIVERDAEGQPVRVCGTLRDISDQKQIEQRLRLLSVAIENNPVATMMTSKDGIIEYVNPKFEQVTGFSEAEVVGQKPNLMSAGETDPKIYENLWQHLNNKQAWSGELWNKNKKGDQVLESIQISPVLNENSEVVNYVATKQDITKRRELEETVWKQANFDELTGIANRSYFKELAKTSMQRAKRQESYAVFIYIDLNDFKLINDECGHDAGDEVLKEFSLRLASSVRSTDVVSRIGGDEFAVVVESLNSLVQIDSVIHTIREHTTNLPFKVKTWEGRVIEIPLKASFGSAIYPNDALTIDDLLIAADKSMYNQKRTE